MDKGLSNSARYCLAAHVELRPEMRYEHSLDVDAYDNPTATVGAGKHYQLTAAADMIFHF